MSLASGLGAAQVRDAAPLFAALGDETRFKLVARLAAQGPDSVAQLASKSAVSRQAISKHLDVLASVSLVTSHRRGRERIRQLEPKRLADAQAYLDRISRQWDGALARLQAFIEPSPKGH